MFNGFSQSLVNSLLLASSVDYNHMLSVRLVYVDLPTCHGKAPYEES
jgi:hypothetical protein